MKRIINLGILLICVFAVSCKNEVDKATEEEQVKISKYLADHPSIKFEELTSGLYYHTISSGTGDSAKNEDFVKISLLGSKIEDKLDASKMDTGIFIIVGDGFLMPGIEEGLSLMRVGDSVELLIPFKLAYYNTSASENNFDTYHIILVMHEIIKDTLAWELNRIDNFLLKHSLDTAIADSSGFCFIKHYAGSGDSAQPGDNVTIHFIGYIMNGVIFASASQYNPFTFTLEAESDKIIKGLNKGISLMHVGDTASLIVPSSMAYGRHYQYFQYSDYQGFITPYSTLIYDLTLVSVQKY